MADFRLTKDFGCCGSWEHCAQQKGCIYGKTHSDYEENMDSYLHFAAKHCNVFKKLYIERDQDFIESWTHQDTENGAMRHKLTDVDITKLSKLSANDLLEALKKL